MKNKHTSTTLAALMLLGAYSAEAHLSYTGRDFGTFIANGLESPNVKSITNLSGTFGWADGTDADLGDSHRLRAFRFTLTNPANVTLEVLGSGALLPAFSIYQGLAHVAPDLLDHDSSAHSLYHLGTLGAGPWEGCFNALGDWKIGNIEEPAFSSLSESQKLAGLSTFTYIGHAADGTSANFGSASGILGDGLANGQVTASFDLPAGNYTVMIGGANYADSIGATSPYPAQSLTATLTVVPEPSSALLLGIALPALLLRRRKK